MEPRDGRAGGAQLLASRLLHLLGVWCMVHPSMVHPSMVHSSMVLTSIVHTSTMMHTSTMVYISMVHPTTSPGVTNSPRDTPGLWHRTCALYVTGPGLRDRPQLRDGAYDTDLQFVTGPGLRDRPVTVSCAAAPSDLMLGSSDGQDPNVSRRSCRCQTILLDRATSDNKGRSGGKTFRLLSDASSGIFFVRISGLS